MGMNIAGNAMQNTMVQPENNVNPFINVTSNTQTQQPVQTSNNQTDDSYAKLTEMKRLFDAGVITADDFEKAKKQLLGI